MPFQDKRICIRSCCVPDLIIVTLPDIPKDVSGHDAQEGEQEEPHEDRDPGAADGQDTGHPVTVVDLGEKRRGRNFPEESHSQGKVHDQAL